MTEKMQELYEYKEKYEKEKLFAEAKIAVVDEMIANEHAKEQAKKEEEQEIIDNQNTIAI